MSKRASEFKDFDLEETISFGEYLPDTNEIIYARSFYEEADSVRKNQVVVQSLKDKSQEIITAGGMGEGNPKVSSDNKKILFLSALPETGRQLYVYDRETKEVTRMTNMRFGLFDPLWSPDGKWILFTSMAADGMEEEWLQTMVNKEEQAKYTRERAKKPVEITDFGYKFDGLGFAQPEVMHLWVVPTDGSCKAKRITAGPANFMHAVWAPDSAHVMCESNLYCKKEISIAMDVLTIDIATLEVVRVTKDKLVVSYPNPVRPLFTPDGKYIIVGILDYKAGYGAATGYPACILHRVSLDGTEITPIFEKTDECFDSVQFPYNAHCGMGLEKVRISSDGTSVLFAAGSRGECRIWKVAIYGDEHRPVAVTKGKVAYNGLGVPRLGKVLAARTEPNRPEAYYLIDERTGEEVLCLQSGKDMIEYTALSPVEDFFFETLDGESKVHGFCMPPQNAKKGEKYPTIVYVHGGPHPFYCYGFDLEYQCFAGAGFGVIYCNPRGSSGYGDVHRNLERAMDGSAYTDIMQFVSEACKRYDWIDEDRLGFTGGSYGGYMTNYTATRAKKFKAYITQRAVVNDLISFASSDMQGDSTSYPTFGEYMVHAVENSVICGMEKVNAPFLILHGEDDLRCPVEGAHQLFVALKDSHAEDFPVKLVLYPFVSHNQPSHPKQRQHYYKTMLDWFTQYL